jgi:hypothetical protein
MKDEPKAGITEVEVEMVIRDKDGRIKSIDHEVTKHGKTR